MFSRNGLCCFFLLIQIQVLSKALYYDIAALRVVDKGTDYKSGCDGSSSNHAISFQ